MKVSVALAALLCTHVVLARERNVCSNNDSYIVPHEDCDKYYLCSAGIPYSLNCPPVLLYNTHTQDCDWPQNVDCGDRNAPEDGGDGSGPVVTSEPEPVPTTTRAPETTVIVVETTTIAPSQNECPVDTDEEKILPHPNCNQFYKCNYGFPVAFDCWPGTLFNLKTLQCDWPEEVECGDRHIPGTMVLLPEAQAPIVKQDDDEHVLYPNDNSCPEDPSIEKLLPHEYCNQFYKCSSGVPVAIKCQPGLLYNLETERCDWSHEVNCGDRYIPEENINSTPTVAPTPTQSPTQVTEDDIDPDLFPNENDCPEDSTVEKLLAHQNCHQFYQCTFGEPVEMSCWSGLHFNLKTMQCDWPHEVDCGDRIVAVTTLRKKLL